MLHRILLFICALLPLNAQSFVEGTVVESVSKSPLPNVTVQIRYTKPLDGVSSMSVQNTGPSTQTDAAGRFRIEVASPSEFRFIVSKDGYSPVDSPDSRTIALTRDESQSGVVLTLAAACAIEGRVFGPELDKPVARLPVSIQKFMSFEGMRTFMPAGRTITDEDGRYRFPSLSPGRYRLVAGPSQQPRMRPPDAQAEPLMIYPATYFPDSPGESGATTIDLLPGAQQAGLDFRLRRAEALRVRVKATLPDGVPPAGGIELERRLTLSAGMTVIAPLGTLTGSNEFVIEAIGTEPFGLQANTDGDSGGKRLYGAMSIVSSGKQDDQVMLILSPGVAITGTLHSEGVKPGRNDPLWTAIANDLTVRYRSATYEPSRTPAPARVNRESGSWRLDEVVPSPLRIDVAGLPPGYVVTAMSHNGANVPIGHADVGYGALSHNIDITVAQVANSISGTVTKDGVPVPEAVVCLQREPIPQSRVGWQERGVTTDERGRYSAASLAPGSYRVCAMSPDGAFEALWTCLASIDYKRVEIGKNTNATVNLTVP